MGDEFDGDHAKLFVAHRLHRTRVVRERILERDFLVVQAEINAALVGCAELLREFDEFANEGLQGGPLGFHRHSVTQQMMEAAIDPGELGRVGSKHFANGVLLCLRRDVRIQLGNRVPQPPPQHPLAKRIPLRRRFTGRELRPVTDRLPHRPKPFQRGVFDDGFVESHAALRGKRSIVPDGAFRLNGDVGNLRMVEITTNLIERGSVLGASVLRTLQHEKQ